ncbi:unnamed protein product [Phytophthora fragariaefolia]|uniref:Unnamed protein product n=1 Tax=Phytophthora fragariaefolia TaxID=1490495 RepID=A0A9W6XKK1_9STRA|nr:unnamed protein product [Phytophthora fragariaefolia]
MLMFKHQHLYCKPDRGPVAKGWHEQDLWTSHVGVTGTTSVIHADCTVPANTMPTASSSSAGILATSQDPFHKTTRRRRSRRERRQAKSKPMQASSKRPMLPLLTRLCLLTFDGADDTQVIKMMSLQQQSRLAGQQQMQHFMVQQAAFMNE